ncbi:hypothetical protein H696_02355 [Fonticula alba]|uniref:Nudix hydrolase domain-containing protein n=1 Tax=Fonticula alba TaxID=691883 RepID=A0A058ZBV7_FONAL|nr:hypothetical protein H696_02355 [Fonticula alba]KCV71408.1 hypothetical protein H696_02355 [Fonticula alba]|eukprot:XP_009494531.1 hypothetical protein H696_02355 [Fonticula alba]
MSALACQIDSRPRPSSSATPSNSSEDDCGCPRGEPGRPAVPRPETDPLDVIMESMASSCKDIAEHVSIEWLHTGTWLKSGLVHWRVHGEPNTWEMIARTTRIRPDDVGFDNDAPACPAPSAASPSVDAVDILALVKDSTADTTAKCPGIVVELIYRPPTARWCLELPSGLVDPGETLQTTALRELAEETGWHGDPTSARLLPATFQYSSGVADETGRMVILDAYSDDPRNQVLRPNLEPNELIFSITFPLHGLQSRLERYARMYDFHLDPRLYSLSVGLSLAAMYPHCTGLLGAGGSSPAVVCPLDASTAAASSEEDDSMAAPCRVSWPPAPTSRQSSSRCATAECSSPSR